ncbi:MAG: hypothetical protein PUF72_07415 [Clostridiales bacterium]|nr:hypothetical protein [Clostridiales bacterium]
MEDLILKIIDIEEQAQELMKDAKQADSAFESSLDAETHKLHEKIKRETEQRCREISIEQEREAKERCEMIQNEEKYHAEELRKKYEHNKEEWVNRIFKNIIG